jgi:hypothetical protein
MYVGFLSATVVLNIFAVIHIQRPITVAARSEA